MRQSQHRALNDGGKGGIGAVTSRIVIVFGPPKIVNLFCALLVVSCAGCVSDSVEEDPFLQSYQRAMINRSRFFTDKVQTGKDKPLSLLSAGTPGEYAQKIDIEEDPNTGTKRAFMTIEEVLARTLANSPEIQVVAQDPEIAEKEISKAAADFDPALFGRTEYGKNDNPVNSIYEPGQSDTRTVESGVKQKTPTGAEWSTSYAITRGWDDLFGRTLSKRYEPVLSFQLRQPLLSNGWTRANLAGVDVAKLNYQIALQSFREKAEIISAQAIALYWRLKQAREDLEIQQQLFDTTLETYEKVKGRQQIDATDVQVKQVENSIETRRAQLVQAQRQVEDVRDALVRLMAAGQLTLLDNVEIVPATEPMTKPPTPDQTYDPGSYIESALLQNARLAQARFAVKVADINIEVAQNQRMPRLDLTFTASSRGLDDSVGPANDHITRSDYTSYFVGLSLEYPIGNRRQESELVKRRIERRQALASLQNLADQVAVHVREQIRKINASLSEIDIQKKAVEAARIQLEALEDSEPVRDRLTPELLLVKLQGQESLAQARRAYTAAIADYNTAKAELAQTSGTIFSLHILRDSIPAAAGTGQSGSEDLDMEAKRAEGNPAG